MMARARGESVGEKVRRRSRAMLPKSSAEVLGVRVLVCSVAVALLWCTSLGVASSLASWAILSPSFDTITDSFVSFFDRVSDEKSNYVTCVDVQTAQCTAAYDAALEVELERTAAGLLVNEALRDSTDLTQAACTGAKINVLDALIDYRALGIGSLPYVSDGSCSAEEIDYVADLTFTYEEVQSVAYSISSGFAGDSTDEYNAVLEYVELRRAYDEEYIANKTGILTSIGDVSALAAAEALDSLTLPFELLNVSALVSCIALTTGCDPYDAGALAAFQDARDELQGQLTELSDTYQVQIDSVDAKSAQLVATAVELNDNLDALSDALTADGIVSYDSDIAGMSLPTENFEFELAPLPSYPAVPSAEEMFDSISFHVADYDALLNETKYLVAAAGYAVVDAAVAGVDSALDFSDYDPPTFNTTEASANYTSMVDEFNTLMAAFLGEVEYTSGVVTEYVEDIDYNYTETDFESTFDYTIAYLTDEGFDFNEITVLVDNFTLLLFSLDIAYRVLRSLHMVRKHWHRSVVPAADVTLHKVERKRGMSDFQRLVLCCTSPLAYAALVMVFIGLFIAALSAVYVPLYTNYVDGCVTSTNGTLLSRNMHAVAFNYAQHDGKEAEFEYVEDYNKKATGDCSGEGASTLDSYTAVVTEIESAVSLFELSSYDFQLLDRCLNQTQLAEAFVALNWTASSLLPATHPDGAACYESMASIDDDIVDSVVDCDNLPTCDITCDGPRDIVIEMYSFSAACHAEWSVHSDVWTGILAFVIFVSLNVGRVWLVNGLVSLHWKALSNGVFEYQGTCDLKGRADKHEEPNDEAFHRLIRDRLEHNIQKIKRTGKFRIFMAVITQVPWIVGLCLVSVTII